jgi:hypothetical protein
MITLSPDERAAELKWIARLVFAAGLVMGLCGREDLAFARVRGGVRVLAVQLVPRGKHRSGKGRRVGAPWRARRGPVVHLGASLRRTLARALHG